MPSDRVFRGAQKDQRGTALLVVTFVLIIILVGGLAAVAVTSGELSSSRGYRTRQVTRACAEAAVEHARAIAETGVQVPDTSLGNLTYHTGHYGTAAQDSLDPLDSSAIDTRSLGDGANITNTMLDGSQGVHVLSATATCSGSGYGEREMQMIFLYGTPMESR